MSQHDGEGSAAGGSLTDVERLLMEQYDIQSEQPTAAQEREPEPDTPPPRGRSDTDQDVTSLDAQNFSVDAWLNSRKHLSLEMLLQQQKALRGDVRRFKSDTQTLVHDNYSRFIAAADIIRTMRGEFEGMVGDTDALAAKTQAATGFSEDLSSGLQVNRNELADLTRLESLLLQLKTLRRVPAELRQFVAKRDFGSAVLLYSKAQRLLQSHGHHGLLRGVAAESEEIMQGVHNQLTQMLGLSDAEGSSVGATVQMLRILGVSAPSMRKHFTASRTAAIATVLETCSRQAQGMATSDGGQASVQLQTLVAGLNGKLLPMLSQAVTIYTEAFGTAASGSSAAAPIASLVQSASTGYLHVLRQAVAAHCSVSAVISCPIHCATGPREAQRAWELHGASGFVRGDFGTGELVDTLRQLRADASRHADILAGFDLLTAIDEVIRGSIRYALGTATAAVEQTVVNMALGLSATLASSGSQLGALSTQLSAWPAACTAVASLGCATLLKAFAAVAAHPLIAQVPAAVFSTAQQQARDVLLDTAARLKAIAQHAPTGAAATTVRSQLGFATGTLQSGRVSAASGVAPFSVRDVSQATTQMPSETSTDASGASELLEAYSCAPEASATEAPHIVHLIFSRSLEALQETTVVEVVEAIAEQQAAYPALAERSTSDTPPFVAKAIRTQLSGAAHKLLQAYVQRHAREAAVLVTDAFADGAFLQQDVGSVQGPRPVCFALMKRFADVATEAAHVLPPGEALPPSLTREAPRHGRMQSRDSAATDAPDPGRFSLQPSASLFRERGTLAVRSVQPNVHSVVLALCTHVMQSMVEAVRLDTCSLGAVHQCQVDMRCLHCALPMPALLPFFQDVIASCESRCLAANLSLLPPERVDELQRAPLA